jgi:hypothetical protein
VKGVSLGLSHVEPDELSANACESTDELLGAAEDVDIVVELNTRHQEVVSIFALSKR